MSILDHCKGCYSLFSDAHCCHKGIYPNNPEAVKITFKVVVMCINKKLKYRSYDITND